MNKLKLKNSVQTTPVSSNYMKDTNLITKPNRVHPAHSAKNCCIIGPYTSGGKPLDLTTATPEEIATRYTGDAPIARPFAPRAYYTKFEWLMLRTKLGCWFRRKFRKLFLKWYAPKC